MKNFLRRALALCLMALSPPVQVAVLSGIIARPAVAQVTPNYAAITVAASGIYPATPASGIYVYGLAYGAVTIAGTVTSVPFGIDGSADNGTTWFAVPFWNITAPGTTFQSTTATAPTMYGVQLAGLTNVRFNVSGFSGSGVTLKLTGSSVQARANPGTTGGGGAPTGAAGGDLAGTYPNPSVAQLNGAAVPTSSTFVGTNSSKQLITQTAATMRGFMCSGTFPTPGYYCDPNTGAYAAIPTVLNAPNPLTVDAEWAFNTGSGTTVPDITGNGHDGTFGTSTAAPSWGTYGVNFLRTDTAITPPQLVATNITAWKSFCVAVEPYSSLTSSGITAPANPYAAAATIFGASANTGVLFFEGVNGSTNRGSGGIQPAMFKTSNASASAAQQGYGQLHTYCVVPGTPDSYYVDGVLQPLQLSNGTLTDTTTTGIYEFGTGFSGTSTAFKGTILYSTLSVGTSWTAAQVASETKYIQSKISTRPLPTYPKLGYRVDQILFSGNSLFAGALGTGVWTSVLSLNNSYTIRNSSIFGKNLTDMDWLAESTWMTQVSQGGRTIAFIGEASNDLCGNGYTAAFAWQSAISAIAKARSVGAIPVIATTISRTGCDTSIPAFNSLVRKYAFQVGAAAIFDNAERPEFSPNGTNYTNLTYYKSDGAHLTGGTALNATTGYGLFATGASKLVNTLDGSNSLTPDITASNAFVGTDANNFVVQTPTQAATHVLADCSWVTGQTKTIVNGSSQYAITVSSQAVTVSGSSVAAPIVGGAAIAPLQSAVFTAQVNSATAGSCSWVRSSGAAISTLRTPATSADSCTAGDSWDDANFHYVCTAANTIKRISLTAF